MADTDISSPLDFENLNNTRDLGGMPAADGRRIRAGKLIRSGHLYFASVTDLERLEAMVSTVVDFRTAQEREEKPDPELAYATNHHLPILGKSSAGVTREEEADRVAALDFLHDAEAAYLHMRDTYTAFPVSEVALAGYRRFVEILVEPHEGAVLWHCTAGKDRAGFASIIVEEALGVPRNVIARDYLFTNECLSGEVGSLMDMLSENVPAEGRQAAKAAMRYLFGAEQEYLDALYASVAESWGTFGRFLERGLGVTPEVRDQLRGMYLE